MKSLIILLIRKNKFFTEQYIAKEKEIMAFDHLGLGRTHHRL